MEALQREASATQHTLSLLEASKQDLDNTLSTERYSRSPFCPFFLPPSLPLSLMTPPSPLSPPCSPCVGWSGRR
jgi:hypothetical protein